MAVNLLPSHVPIGYVDNDVKKPIYASKELLRAFDSLMLHVGGQSTPAVGDVTGLSAVPIVGGIRISGTLPNNPRLKEVQLWMGTTNVLATASMITSGIASTYDKTNLLPTDGARYFWVLCVDMANNKGNFVGPVSATAGGADWQTQVTGAGKPSNYADVTTTVLTNAATSIAMNSTNLLKSLNGLAGVTIGSGGIVGRDSAGNATFTLDAATGAAAFKGTITGGSLAIDGTAVINGNTYSADVGAYSALVVNEAGVRQWGVSGLGGTAGAGINGVGYFGHGVQGSATAAGKYGVYGIAKAGSLADAGVYGWSGLPSKPGVHAVNSGAGPGLKITGYMEWGAYGWLSPDGTTKLLRADGNWTSDYATSGHNHSAYQVNGINIFNITRNTPDNAAYSTDGGVTWTTIQLKFT